MKCDSNGYAPSILKPYCYHAGDKARHEVFHGANRNKSKSMGTWLELCPSCHSKVHGGAKIGFKGLTLDLYLKREAQKQAMDYYNWTENEFIKEFGKSYLHIGENND